MKKKEKEDFDEFLELYSEVLHQVETQPDLFSSYAYRLQKNFFQDTPTLQNRFLKGWEAISNELKNSTAHASGKEQ